MALFDVGRVCMKIAGRDAGKQCVVVETVDDRFVVVDGQTRRRRVNILHLEPLMQTVDVSTGASHGEVAKALGDLGVEVGTSKPRTHAPRPLQKRKGKAPAAKVADVGTKGKSAAAKSGKKK